MFEGDTAAWTRGARTPSRTSARSMHAAQHDQLGARAGRDRRDRRRHVCLLRRHDLECDLDGGGFSPCPAPSPTWGLSTGRTFRVRAVERALRIRRRHAHGPSTRCRRRRRHLRPAEGQRVNTNSASFQFVPRTAGRNLPGSLDGAGFSGAPSHTSSSGWARGHTTSASRRSTRSRTGTRPRDPQLIVT